MAQVAANGITLEYDSHGKAGVAAGYGAENLRKNEATIEGAFAWWKSSSIHNSNMLIPQVRRLGFARLPATGKGFWVLIVTN